MSGPGAGFPKSRRLLRAQEFRAVLSRARRVRSRMFTAAVTANGLGYPRLGITVSRRVSLRATVRNRIKRAAREAFRRRQHAMPATDIVLLAAKPAGESDVSTVRSDLEQLLGRIGCECADAHQGR